MYLQDIGLAFFAPRKFLWRVVTDSPADLVRRFIVYGAGFSLFETALFAAVLPKVSSLSVYEIAGAGILEIATSLIFLPVFLLVSRTLRASQWKKTALLYTIFFRFFYPIPALIFFGLFLLTENYLFAVIKGVAAFLGILCLVIVFPVILTNTLRRRFFAVIGTFVACILVLAPIGWMLEQFMIVGRESRGSTVFYDPIGKEVDEAAIHFNVFIPGTVLFDIYQSLAARIKGVKIEPGSPGYQTITKWPRDKDRLRAEWEKERKRLENKQAVSHFETTRKFINIKLEELDAAQDVAQALDVVFGSDEMTIETLQSLFDKYISLSETEVRALTLQRDFNKMRSTLKDLELID